MQKTQKLRALLGMMALSALLVGSAQGLAAETPPAAPVDAAQGNAHPVAKPADTRIFATLGKEQITAQTFFDTFQEAMKRKYFHGKIPASEVAKFQREVGRRMVEEHLLLKEAQRLGIKPDKKKIDDVVAKVDAKYGQNPQFRDNREKMVAPLIKEMTRKELLTQLEARTRTVSDPKDSSVRTYYEINPGKFTEPQENKISMILLRVDPSAGSAAWEAARLKGEELAKRIRNGEDFASLSKEYSSDKSATKGGKMGYLHKGMLAPAAEEAIDKLAKGEITDPIMVLEGYGIFRLDDRIEAELLPYEKARKRASELLKRELGEDAWNALKEKLWAKGSVKINEELYLPLQEEPPAPADSKNTATGGAATPGTTPASASGK